MLRSSAGNGVARTNSSGRRAGDRLRAGMTSSPCCGGFQESETDALVGGFLLLFLESSTPCLALENSSRSGYARPPSRKIDARYSLSLPDFTQASMRARLVSFTHNRVAC